MRCRATGAVNPALGTMDDLAALAADLRAGRHLARRGLHLQPHQQRARVGAQGGRGRPAVRGLLPDLPRSRRCPTRTSRPCARSSPTTTRARSCSCRTGRWIWATFYHFQWDLNYANPAVFRAMAGEMLFLANQGVEILRMDAVAFIWKRLGTPSRVAARGAPAAAGVQRGAAHGRPEPAVQVRGDRAPRRGRSSTSRSRSASSRTTRCRWRSRGRRSRRAIRGCCSRRSSAGTRCPPGTAWVNYVRSHDDIGWTFADEDAAELGINGYYHRRFLNEFYVGPASRAPSPAACRSRRTRRPATPAITGTTASLAGLEAGDAGRRRPRAAGARDRDVDRRACRCSTSATRSAQLNDYSYLDDPATAGDSRWVHRPARPGRCATRSGRMPPPTPAACTRD